MDLFAPRHLIIILLVALVVFGTKKIKTLGADLGGAVKGFKQAMREGESEASGAVADAHRAQPELIAPTADAATASQSNAKVA